MEQGIIEDVITSNNTGISNIENATVGTEYVLSRNNANEIIILEPTPDIQGLQNIQQNTRYQLTRNNNNNVEPIENDGISIPTPTTGDLTYGVRRDGNNFFLTRTPAFTEFIFASNNAAINANFNVLGITGSRCVHVVNSTCKIIKFGLLHVSNFRTNGLINTTYTFEFIINNLNQPPFSLTLNNSVGTERARVVDLEDLNVFLNAGDCIGLRFVSGNTGNYMECRILMDTNNRQENFNTENIE